MYIEIRKQRRRESRMTEKLNCMYGIWMYRNLFFFVKKYLTMSQLIENSLRTTKS